MNNKQLRAYYERWRRRKSTKFKKAVEKAAQELAFEMFVDMVKELDGVYTRLGISNLKK